MNRLSAILAAMLTVLLGVGAASAAAPEPRTDLEVIIAIDASDSMDDALSTAKEAALEFVAALPDDTAIGVETFADTVRVLTTPTIDRALVTSQIRSITTDGDTALYDMVVSARDEFTPSVANKVLVVLSDGRDEGSAATLAQAVAAAGDMQVESISLATERTDTASLQQLGAVTAADDADALSAAFARVADLIVEVVESTTTTSTTTTTVPAATAAPTTVASTTSVPTTSPTTAATTTTAVIVAPAAIVDEPPRSSGTSDWWMWGGAACVFASLLAVGVMFLPRQRVSRTRLGSTKPTSMSEMGTRTASAIDDILERRGVGGDLSSALGVAGISMEPAEFVAVVGLGALLLGLIALVWSGPILAIALCVIVLVGARWYVSRAARKRRVAFQEQLNDVLQLIVSSLRSGYGIHQAVESVADEADEPARSEFARALAEVRLGRELPAALSSLAERMRSKDLSWVVSAIEINRETGGNLGEILGQVAVTIRERGQLARQVQTLTAEGRLSAKVLTALPFVMLFWQWRANPELFAILTEGIGIVALTVAGLLLVAGSIWVRKVVNSVEL